ncbi:hypothetical protein [Corynebacterium glyciniphilum]|uniref:Putative secreted protein n=1 Tax=Corynebacterium glyciniphilum AJ 3170 TaxID=1404245 RepID=X5E6N4_9CORY|nr:hypothetical protein [Corynebacterium glyciniphilum]AHW63110.1 Putative secreted protein [Corynebacterium glyciniphilum AJ 3170]
MGRLVIVVLVIVTVIVLWKAFGPKTWNNTSRTPQNNQFPSLGRQKNQVVKNKGPDDDPDFLWNIKKERFKAQREAERREQEAVERARRGEHWKPGEKDAGTTSATGEAKENDTPPASPESTDHNPGKGQSDGTGTRGSQGDSGRQEKKDGENGAQG